MFEADTPGRTMHGPFRVAPHLRRYRRIVTVLARHGFGSFLETLQLERRLAISPRFLKVDRRLRLTPAAHLRLALEELGPTFIKMGQILSTRPDILPPEFIKELSKLQDDVPPADWEDIRLLLEKELHADPDQIFASIDPQPLAAASLAQVHPAVLKNGDQVVLKIQRPKIQATIGTDLEILRDLASLAQRTPWGEMTHPEDIVDEFGYTLQNELDYFREGRNADRFRENFAGEASLYIPKIYWEHTTRRVLVMERISGTKINDLEALEAAGLDRKQVALNSARIIIQEVMHDGFFHADPHPGNFIVMPEGVIGAMDFGMVGELNDLSRRQLVRLYISSIRHDPDSIVDELIRMRAASSNANRFRLGRDIGRLLNKYSGSALQELRAQEILDEVMRLAAHHHLSLPTHYWLLGKTLAMLEGLGLLLDPEFDIFAVSEPYVRDLKWQALQPDGAWGQALLQQGSEWLEFFNVLPRSGRRLLEKFDRNEAFEVGLKDTHRLLTSLNRMVNRLSLSILIAGLVVGLAIIMAVIGQNIPLQVVVVVGFLAMAGLGIWLAASIMRGS